MIEGDAVSSNGNNNNKSNGRKSNGKDESKTPHVGRLTATGGGNRDGGRGPGTYEDLHDYARRLLASFQVAEEPGSGGSSGKEVVSPLGSEVDLEEQEADGEVEEDEEGALTGCREAVEILTRNPKKGTLICFCHSWFIFIFSFLACCSVI